jgi:hypothetical protein
MKNSALFYGAIAIALIAIAIDVYYVIPGITHILATNPDHGPYPKHLIVASAVAVVSVIAAFVIRIRSKSSTLQKI